MLLLRVAGIRGHMLRHRKVLAPILVALLIGLSGWWSWLQFEGLIGFSQMMKRPGSLDGQQVVLSLVEVTAVNDADHYEVERGSLHIEVKGPTAGLVLGSEVSVGGVFHETGMRVDEAWRTTGTLRPWKRRFGYLGLVFFGGLVFFRIRRTGAELEVVG